MNRPFSMTTSVIANLDLNEPDNLLELFENNKTIIFKNWSPLIESKQFFIKKKLKDQFGCLKFFKNLN